MTDGRDENAASNGPGSLRTWDDVMRKLQQTDATVYAVGIGTRVDRRALQELADRSGGAAYFPSDVTALAADYQQDSRRAAPSIRRSATNRRTERATANGGRWRFAPGHRE